MLLTESLLVAAVAGVFSTGLAYGIPAGVERMITQMPHYPMRPDWLVFAYMAAVTLLAGLAAACAIG